jgi:Tol biopolymer transport system component
MSILTAGLMLCLMPSQVLAQYPGTNSKIYFVSVDGTSIQRSDASGANLETVAAAVNPLSVPVVSKDGTKIVYERTSGLWVVNVNGTNNHQIPNTVNGDYNPVWSPDGNTVYFDVSTDIVSISATGTGRTTLLAGTTNMGYYEPTVSPDGTMLAFIGYNRDAQVADVFKMVSTGSPTPTNVTNNQDRDEDFRSAVWVDWSPDGSQLAVVSYTPGEGNVSHVDKISVAGGNYTGVLSLNYGAGDPYYTQVNWSPDGTQMIVTKGVASEGGGFVGLETVNSDGTNDPDLTVLGASGSAWWSIPQTVVVPGLPDVGAVK